MLTASAGAAVFILVLLLIVFAVGGLHLWALVDSIVRPEWAYQRAGSSKVQWILLNVFVGFIAGIIYLVSIRPKLRRVQDQGFGGPGPWPPQAPPPGWYPDPAHRHEMRYWNGWAWTESVATGGFHTSDPLGSW